MKVEKFMGEALRKKSERQPFEELSAVNYLC